MGNGLRCYQFPASNSRGGLEACYLRTLVVRCLSCAILSVFQAVMTYMYSSYIYIYIIIVLMFFPPSKDTPCLFRPQVESVPGHSAGFAADLQNSAIHYAFQWCSRPVEQGFQRLQKFVKSPVLPRCTNSNGSLVTAHGTG